MKKLLILIIIMYLIISLIGCANKEITLSDFKEIKIGVEKEKIHKKFGEPNSMLSGMYGDVYLIKDKRVIIYYGYKGENINRVIDVKISEIEKIDDLTETEKPVIYLYPKERTDISIKLQYNGELLFTYPTYEDGWQVTAYPDGKIMCDNKEYSYLFWDGYSDIKYDFSKGFVVKGEDTQEFLIEKLQYLGLTPKEYNEFIVYWMPRMINNPYNLITFQQETYTINAILEIDPKPDSIQRVYMAYKSLDEKIEIEEQVLQPFKREGFCVIEWGGTEVIDE